MSGSSCGYLATIPYRAVRSVKICHLTTYRTDTDIFSHYQFLQEAPDLTFPSQTFSYRRVIITFAPGPVRVFMQHLCSSPASATVRHVNSHTYRLLIIGNMSPSVQLWTAQWLPVWVMPEMHWPMRPLIRWVHTGSRCWPSSSPGCCLRPASDSSPSSSLPCSNR